MTQPAEEHFDADPEQPSAASGSPEGAQSSNPLEGIAFPSKSHLVSKSSAWRGPAEQRDIDVYRSALPSIVLVHNYQCDPQDIALGQDCNPAGLGSGVLLAPSQTGGKKGIIITNSHVIAGNSKLEVTFPDGTVSPTQVLASIPSLDISFLKIDSPPTSASGVTLGDSDDIVEMQNVMAIGNPLGLHGSGTAGKVSAIRDGFHPDQIFIRGLIQTDAAINPGNSGGALLDRNGRVIGINTFIASQSGGSDGLGFAIPINEVKQQLANLISTGRLVHSGLRLVDSPGGVRIHSVESDSPAAKCGIVSAPEPERGFFGLIRRRQPTSPVLLADGIIMAINGQEVAAARQADSLIAEQALQQRPIVLSVKQPSGAVSEHTLPVSVRGALPFQE